MTCLTLRSFRVKVLNLFIQIFLISPYSVRMRENADHNNSKYRHFLHSDSSLILGKSRSSSWSIRMTLQSQWPSEQWCSWNNFCFNLIFLINNCQVFFNIFLSKLSMSRFVSIYSVPKLSFSAAYIRKTILTLLTFK